MSNPKPKKTELETLKDKWYKKLKDEGFNDIEQDEDNLKEWSRSVFGRKHNSTWQGGWQARFEYYQLATRFLNEYKFETPLQKIVWEYHSNGLSDRETAKVLKAVKIKCSASTAYQIIRKLKARMCDMYLMKTEPRHE
jgi:hypothetical protein